MTVHQHRERMRRHVVGNGTWASREAGFLRVGRAPLGEAVVHVARPLAVEGVICGAPPGILGVPLAPRHQAHRHHLRHEV